MRGPAGPGLLRYLALGSCWRGTRRGGPVVVGGPGLPAGALLWRGRTGGKALAVDTWQPQPGQSASRPRLRVDLTPLRVKSMR